MKKLFLVLVPLILASCQNKHNPCLAGHFLALLSDGKEYRVQEVDGFLYATGTEMKGNILMFSSTTFRYSLQVEK